MKLRSRPVFIRVRYELIEDHDGGEIPDHHQWYAPGRVVYGEYNSTWMMLECENPTCAGRARVSLADILSCPLGKVWPDPPGTKEKYEEMRKQ